MFDPSESKEKGLASNFAEQIIPAEEEVLFPFPISEVENRLVPHQDAPITLRKIRVILIPNPKNERILRLPVWLHELVGWGVFLVILVGFLTLQIYLDRFFSGPLNQLVLIVTVLVEIGFLWRWDFYWY